MHKLEDFTWFAIWAVINCHNIRHLAGRCPGNWSVLSGLFQVLLRVTWTLIYWPSQRVIVRVVIATKTTSACSGVLLLRQQQDLMQVMPLFLHELNVMYAKLCGCTMNSLSWLKIINQLLIYVFIFRTGKFGPLFWGFRRIVQSGRRLRKWGWAE